MQQPTEEVHQKPVSKPYHSIWYLTYNIIWYLRKVQEQKDKVSTKLISYHHNIPYINYLISYQRLQNAKKTKTAIAKLTDSLSLKRQYGRVSF